MTVEEAKLKHMKIRDRVIAFIVTSMRKKGEYKNIEYRETEVVIRGRTFTAIVYDTRDGLLRIALVGVHVHMVVEFPYDNVNEHDIEVTMAKTMRARYARLRLISTMVKR